MRICCGITFIFILVFVGVNCAAKQDILKTKYPFARLTPDYGILTEQDLLTSEENAYPVPSLKTHWHIPIGNVSRLIKLHLDALILIPMTMASQCPIS